MKYIKILLLIVVVTLLIIFLSIFYVTNKNNNYQENIIKEVKDNYKIENIISVIKYDNNYIITSQDKIIVLNKKYEPLLEVAISQLAENPNNYKLIYKNNKLYYEKTILKDKKIIYEYYDAYTYEYQSNTILEE